MTRFWSAAAAAMAAATLSTANVLAADTVSGDYVEARSASVYAGPCHYNGELTTAGREAVLAFQVRAGSLAGQDLAGLSVVAVVAGNDNLANAQAARRAVVYVSDKATPAQRDALVALIKAKANDALGQIVAVKAAPQTLRFDAKAVTVKSGHAVSLNVSRYPCEHCRMPAQTWYAPLAPTAGAVQVAQGVSTGFSDPTLGVTWRQEASDNAFVGTFAL